MNNSPKPIPQSLLDLVVYDEESPTFLYWKGTGSGRKYEHAGSVNSWGYWRVFHKRKGYTIHRIVWALHYGDVPPVIDHINGNPSDNRITNLRDGTEHNKANRKKVSTKNKYKGVIPLPSGRYRVRCGKKPTGGIDIVYNTEIEAVLAYNENALRLWGEYASLNIVEYQAT